MADKKQLMRDFVMWGTENDKNRKEAIDAACRIITLLYAAPPGYELSKDQLDKLAGGKFSWQNLLYSSISNWDNVVT